MNAASNHKNASAALTQKTLSPATKDQRHTVRAAVTRALEDYFAHLEGAAVSDLYNLVLCEVEAPLFASVMAFVEDNQSKAAELLGMNRGTLRKKLKQYNLL